MCQSEFPSLDQDMMKDSAECMYQTYAGWYINSSPKSMKYEAALLIKSVFPSLKLNEERSCFIRTRFIRMEIGVGRVRSEVVGSQKIVLRHSVSLPS